MTAAEGSDLVQNRLVCSGRDVMVAPVRRNQLTVLPALTSTPARRMIPKKPVPGLTRDGNRFSEMIMRKQKMPHSAPIQAEPIKVHSIHAR